MIIKCLTRFNYRIHEPFQFPMILMMAKVGGVMDVEQCSVVGC